MKKKIRLAVFCLVTFASALVLLVSSTSMAQETGLPKAVGIATHPKGSLLNLIGSAFGKVITGHLSIAATDRPYTGYFVWLPLVDRGELEMGVATCLDPYYSYNGLKPYREKLGNLRLLCAGATLDASFIVRASSGLKAVHELKGKRVCIDKSSVATRTFQEGVLKAGGLDPEKGIKVVNTAGVVEPVRAVMEGRAVAAWASVGMGVVRELIAKVGGITWLPVTDSEKGPRTLMIKKFAPGSHVKYVKAGARPTVSNDTWVTAVPLYLLSHKHFSEEAAYQITKSIWENREELIAVHPIFKAWTHKAMLSEEAVVPYHAGAIRLYKEVRAWTDKNDKAQHRLLGQ